MKNNLIKNYPAQALKPNNCVAILGIVTEMARRLNESIAKIRLQPLSGALASSGAGKSTSCDEH